MNSRKHSQVSQGRAIRLPEVCRHTGQSRATIWRRVHDDPDFPKPFKLSAGITVWDEAEVFDWLSLKKDGQAPTHPDLFIINKMARPRLRRDPGRHGVSPMHAPHTSTGSAGQELSKEEQFFAALPLSRLLVELGVAPFPDFGLLEFDAVTLQLAHRTGRLALPATLLDEVNRVSRGEGRSTSLEVRREIEARARELLSRSKDILNAVAQPRAPGKEGSQ